jgi:hypothetical protein
MKFKPTILALLSLLTCATFTYAENASNGIQPNNFTLQLVNETQHTLSFSYSFSFAKQSFIFPSYPNPETPAQVSQSIVLSPGEIKPYVMNLSSYNFVSPQFKQSVAGVWYFSKILVDNSWKSGVLPGEKSCNIDSLDWEFAARHHAPIATVTFNAASKKHLRVGIKITYAHDSKKDFSCRYISSYITG